MDNAIPKYDTKKLRDFAFRFNNGSGVIELDEKDINREFPPKSIEIIDKDSSGIYDVRRIERIRQPELKGKVRVFLDEHQNIIQNDPDGDYPEIGGAYV